MLTIFRKFFGQSESKTAVPVAPVRHVQPGAPVGAVPSVPLAHLSLTAILSRLPDELKALVLQQPDPTATIALPLQLIHKQLASGMVKMSLASLHRQAPPGVFGPLVSGDKRQVEIPLKEVFRHVRPQSLQRRSDQRPLDTPDNDFNLFGNADQPHTIAPTTPENPPHRNFPVASSSPPSTNGRASHSAVQAPATPPSVVAPPSGLRLVGPLVESNGSKVAASAPPAAGPPVTLSLAALASDWPEPFRSEISTLDPATTVTLPGGAVGAGLAKGKIVFTWDEILAGLQPALALPTALDRDTILQLPLKIVAPAFLAVGKNGKTERKSVQLDVDASIPALFTDGRAPAQLPDGADQDIPEFALPPPEARLHSFPATVEEPPAVPLSVSPTELVPEPLPKLALEPAAEGAVPEPRKIATTISEIFNELDRHAFTPAEIVAGTVRLPGVAGAIIALQEGLPVATSLPEGLQSEVVAAFLPQIFARLNQYAGEMKFGEVGDLLFTTHGAHCQIYRLGLIYFAVLGHPGEALPWRELQIIAGELGRQANH